MLTTLSKDYSSVLYFPVEYTNLPADKIVITPLPTELGVKINSFGFNLLWYKLKGKLRPVEFNASFDNMKGQGENNSYFMVTAPKLTEISEQLDNELKVVAIYPDTIFFKFSQRAFKKVPVKADYEMTFEQQYQLAADVSVEPAMVTVSGPMAVVDTISTVYTNKLLLQTISESVTKEVGLVLPKGPNVELSTEKVQVSFPVEKFTESTAEVSVEVINLPDKYKIKLFPEKVEVVCLLPLSRYEEAKATKFKAVVDYGDIKKDSKRLRVRVENAPDFVRTAKAVPETVEYIIQK